LWTTNFGAFSPSPTKSVTKEHGFLCIVSKLKKEGVLSYSSFGGGLLLIGETFAGLVGVACELGGVGAESIIVVTEGVLII